MVRVAIIFAEVGLSTHHTEVGETRLSDDVGTIDLVDPFTLFSLDNPGDVVLSPESSIA